MATAVSDYIATRAPNYVGDSRITNLQSQAEAEIGTIFGDVLRNKAVALLILHWMALDDRAGTSGTGGLIGEEREGQLARKYVVDFRLSYMYPALSQTRWGMELIGLRRGTIIGPMNRHTTF